MIWLYCIAYLVAGIIAIVSLWCCDGTPIQFRDLLIVGIMVILWPLVLIATSIGSLGNYLEKHHRANTVIFKGWRKK